jgi:hypothetical protein
LIRFSVASASRGYASPALVEDLEVAMARIERYTFVNNRARLQRLTDAKLCAGWVKELTTTHLFLKPSTPADIRPSDQFYVEIHGGGRNATFRARYDLQMGDDLVFNIVSAIQFGSSSENVRQTVNGMTGRAIVGEDTVEFKVVDVSEGGAGLLVPIQLTKGDLIDMEIETPQGAVHCSAEIRYSRPDSAGRGHFRTGVAFYPMHRLERARWQRMLHRTAA